jgi:hypothetical protein
LLGRDNHTLDISFTSDTDWKYWANGLRLLVAKQRYPDLAYITKVYADMRKPRLTLDETVRFLHRLNFKAPRALIAEKFEVQNSLIRERIDFLFFLPLSFLISFMLTYFVFVFGLVSSTLIQTKTGFLNWMNSFAYYAHYKDELK